MSLEKVKLLKVGDNAPDFELLDQNGELHTLKQYLNKGKKILIYFYPKDDTPGCTKEACNFRDSVSDLEKAKLIVLGVSKDSVKSHKKFAEKYNLNFPILSDETKEVIKKYNAWAPKKFMGKEFLGVLRKSILIDEEGKILKIYEDVNASKHKDEVLADA